MKKGNQLSAPTHKITAASFYLNKKQGNDDTDPINNRQVFFDERNELQLRDSLDTKQELLTIKLANVFRRCRHLEFHYSRKCRFNQSDSDREVGGIWNFYFPNSRFDHFFSAK